MKNIKTVKKRLTITSSSALAGVLLVTNFAACSMSDRNESTLSSSSDTINSSTQNSDITTNDITESSRVKEIYSFTWTDDLSEKFSNHCKKVFKRNLAGYVISFGFTEELNKEVLST